MVCHGLSKCSHIVPLKTVRHRQSQSHHQPAIGLKGVRSPCINHQQICKAQEIGGYRQHDAGAEEHAHEFLAKDDEGNQLTKDEVLGPNIVSAWAMYKNIMIPDLELFFCTSRALWINRSNPRGPWACHQASCFFDNTFGSQLELADIQQGELSWSIMSHHDSPSSAIARSLVKTGKHPLLQRKPTQKGSETQWISFMFTCFWWSPYSWWALRAKIWWINNE